MLQKTERVILVRYGEIHLKGLNRPYFERRLVSSINDALRGMEVRVERAQSRVYVYGLNEEQISDAVEKLQRVFGIHSVSPAITFPNDWQQIVSISKALIRERITPGERVSFKVYARRADKRFELNSDDINKKLGEALLNEFKELYVDVRTPAIKLGVEVRERCFAYIDEIKCPGGMPAGSNGRAMLLLSGGIDSPVAGYMVAKRGVSLCAVHFYSYPYTSERARDKVVELAKLLSVFTGAIRLHLVPFTDIQLAIHENCPKSEGTILMRRQMMRIAELIAREENAQALITGESIGQVASQTMESLAVTNDIVSMPVFRPLIGFDKNDIVDYARQIGTYETSVLPYEDCCTIFVANHPVTKPNLEKIKHSESLVPYEGMIEKAISDREIVLCHI